MSCAKLPLALAQAKDSDCYGLSMVKNSQLRQELQIPTGPWLPLLIPSGMFWFFVAFNLLFHGSEFCSCLFWGGYGRWEVFEGCNVWKIGIEEYSEALDIMPLLVKLSRSWDLQLLSAQCFTGLSFPLLCQISAGLPPAGAGAHPSSLAMFSTVLYFSDSSVVRLTQSICKYLI